MSGAHVAAYGNASPVFGEEVFLAPLCAVVGDVVLGDRVSVWYGAIVRGDVHSIRVGEETNLQDGAVLHGLLGRWPVVIGRRCSIGHQATIHGAVLEDEVLVGIGARVLDGARIGKRSLVAAGSVVREGMEVPAESLVAGVPAVVKRRLHPEEIQRVVETPDRYLGYARRTREALLAAGAQDPFPPAGPWRPTGS